MNKCLNCGKEVENKYCGVSCQNSYRAKEIRKKYYENPVLCKCCGKIIEFENKRNTYCSHSCAAKKNNIGIARNVGPQTNSIINSLSDEEFIAAIEKSSCWKEAGINMGYKGSISGSLRNQITERCARLNISYSFKRKLIKDDTKQEIFNRRSSWQSARSAIRRDAAKVYKESNKDYACCICGYDSYVEIAHIKSVSSFDSNSSLREINAIENLIALCPNHHWEYDNGLLKL